MPITENVLRNIDPGFFQRDDRSHRDQIAATENHGWRVLRRQDGLYRRRSGVDVIVAVCDRVGVESPVSQPLHQRFLDGGRGPIGLGTRDDRCPAMPE